MQGSLLQVAHCDSYGSAGVAPGNAAFDVSDWSVAVGGARRGRLA
jgi:hypothetical protein